MIIGVCGLYQAGKDTTADYLVKEYGFTKVSWADQLKWICSKYLGWDGQKDDKGRKLLQQVGTEIARDKIRKDYWIFMAKMNMKLLQEFGKTNIVIPDCRYENEQSECDFNLLVTRDIPRDPIILAHRSEQLAQKKFELGQVVSFDNNGTYEQLYVQVDKFMGEIGVDKNVVV